MKWSRGVLKRLGFVCAWGYVAIAAAPPAVLAGRWKLNRELSEFPKEVAFGIETTDGDAAAERKTRRRRQSWRGKARRRRIEQWRGTKPGRVQRRRRQGERGRRQQDQGTDREREESGHGPHHFPNRDGREHHRLAGSHPDVSSDWQGGDRGARRGTRRRDGEMAGPAARRPVHDSQGPDLPLSCIRGCRAGSSSSRPGSRKAARATRPMSSSVSTT